MKKTIVLALGMALFGLSACNTHSHAEREVTSRTYAADDGETVRVHATSDRYYFDDDECGGALSCTSEFVGDVIALPFRAVAGLVDFIF
jgi:predicted small secreted protein